MKALACDVTLAYAKLYKKSWTLTQVGPEVSKVFSTFRMVAEPSRRRLVLYSHLGMAMSVMFVFSVLPLLYLPHHYKR